MHGRCVRTDIGLCLAAAWNSKAGVNKMEWIIIIVLVVLLLAAAGPRAGYYGTASPLYDVLSLLLLVGLVLFLLDLFGVIEIFGVGA
jgi:hypothetical protein